METNNYSIHLPSIPLFAKREGRFSSCARFGLFLRFQLLRRYWLILWLLHSLPSSLLSWSFYSLCLRQALSPRDDHLIWLIRLWLRKTEITGIPNCPNRLEQDSTFQVKVCLNLGAPVVNKDVDIRLVESRLKVRRSVSRPDHLLQ